MGHRRRRRPNPGGGTIHWDGTDECRWSVASVVALVLATKGLISGSFGLSVLILHKISPIFELWGLFVYLSMAHA